MWILVAEAMGALSLLLFIVWWTLGPTHRREREALQRMIDDEAAATRVDVAAGRSTGAASASAKANEGRASESS